MIRQKTRIDRRGVLESGIKIMKNLIQRAFLEIEFQGEEGTGLGPTLEFYSLSAYELKTRYSKLWRKMDDHSLFPAPILKD